MAVSLFVLCTVETNQIHLSMMSKDQFTYQKVIYEEYRPAYLPRDQVGGGSDIKGAFPV